MKLFGSKKAEGNGEMSFMDHIEALRWHIVRSVIVVLILTVIAFFYIDFFFNDVFLAPARPDFWTYGALCRLGHFLHMGDKICIKGIDNFKLVNMEMAGQFTQSISISVYVGVALAFPYIFWEIWRFFAPALKPKEKKYATRILFFSSLLFLLGLLFGYFFTTPMMLQFLMNYQLSDKINLPGQASIPNMIDIDDYMSYATSPSLYAALIFELPIVAFFLAKAGFIGPKMMRMYRKHAIVIILFLAAIITPTPDVVNQSLFALPFILLYEVSILVVARVKGNKERRDAEMDIA